MSVATIEKCARLVLLLTLFTTLAAGRERVLRLAYNEDPRTLDPTPMVEEVNFELVPLLFLPLVDIVRITNVIPCGARSWSASPDWRMFTFHLRTDARFSNGRAVTAADYAVLPRAYRRSKDRRDAPDLHDGYSRSGGAEYRRDQPPAWDSHSRRRYAGEESWT